jgi:hypothetical protein
VRRRGSLPSAGHPIGAERPALPDPPRREGPRTASSHVHFARSLPPSMRSTVSGPPAGVRCLMGSYCVARLVPSRHEHFRIAQGVRGNSAATFTAETSDKTSTMFVELLDGLNRALARLSKGVTGKQAIVDEDLPMA